MWFSLRGPLVNFDCPSQSLRLGSFTTLSFLYNNSGVMPCGVTCAVEEIWLIEEWW